MFRLTMDVESSAQLLGIDPKGFLEFAEKEHLDGVLKFDDHWVVSVFTLAQLLDTSSEELLELIEDYALGEMMAAVEDDEVFQGEASLAVYHSYLEGGE